MRIRHVRQRSNLQSISCKAVFFGTLQENGSWTITATVSGILELMFISSHLGIPGDFPVVGNWSGNGLTNIGTFTPSTGTWQLDTNRDGVLNCAADTCVSSFGHTSRARGGSTPPPLTNGKMAELSRRSAEATFKPVSAGGMLQHIP